MVLLPQSHRDEAKNRNHINRLKCFPQFVCCCFDNSYMKCLFFNNIHYVIFPFSMGVLLITVLMLISVLTLGQNNNDQLTYPSQGIPYQVIKTNRTERFVLPFTSSNNERQNPLVYIYDKAKGPSWILTIQNNLYYNSGQDAKTIIKPREPAPREKSIDRNV